VSSGGCWVFLHISSVWFEIDLLLYQGGLDILAVLLVCMDILVTLMQTYCRVTIIASATDQLVVR
jgi:hypothetical protein